jgi:DNA-binding MarR family transcriptional regulator
MQGYITSYGDGSVVEDIVRGFGFLALGSRLKRIGERLQADTQRIMSEHGEPLQASQYPFLAAIDMLGPLTIGELADAVGISQPGATRALMQLIELGLLDAEPATDDQRRKIVSLSRKGRRLVAAAKRDTWPRIERAVRDLCGDLSGPLLDQLAAIEDGLAAVPLDRRPTVGPGGPRQ